MAVSEVDQSSLIFDHGREWSACTLTGPGKPLNADALAIDFTGGCLAFVVADGVGAMAGSRLASAIGAGTAASWIARRSWLDGESLPALFAAANTAIGEGLRSQNSSGATTIVLAAVAGGCGVVASVGDSEVIAVGATGPGESLNPVDHLPSQTNVLLAWLDGVESFDPHVRPLSVLPHRLCLMTDGVAGTLSYERIADLVRSVEPSEAARTLVLEARAAGSRDDATALVISDRIEDEIEAGVWLPFLRPNRSGS
jgi:serine/threonine protein phosphatase PrpC